jgi:universal stress protein A
VFEVIHSILLPVDFSPASGTSFRLAANLAQRYGASLHLLHVYQDVFSVLSMRTFELTEDVVEAGIRAELEAKFEELLASVAVDVPVTRELRKGDVAEEILDCAASIQADVIVIATNARSGLGHLFIGSIAQRIVRSAAIPVITCRAGAAD